MIPGKNKEKYTVTYFFVYCNLDHDSSDEGIPLTGDEDNGSKSSSDHRGLPTHVYKEYLPSTIYRTGEARSIRVCVFHSLQRKPSIIF